MDDESLSSSKSKHKVTNLEQIVRNNDQLKNFSFPYSLPTIAVKLGEKNHNCWRSQVLPVFTLFQLEGFVNGERPCPEPFILSKSDETGDLERPATLAQLFSILTIAVLIVE
ncbi:uncharacterized protein LOC116110727 [Pistacia vera]|uniref:uncharacterized protein LOC116110727 n=1 Tax=Pistacia vera TaxID=55513 RepID=UPI001262DB27|nr:uncharacterized protein LOC116110727 [Pistacia vera]